MMTSEGARTSHHEVRASEMRETGRTNLAAVRAVRAVGHEVHTHFTLRSLDGAVSLARRHGVALREKLWSLLRCGKFH